MTENLGAGKPAWQSEPDCQRTALAVLSVSLVVALPN